MSRKKRVLRRLHLVESDLQKTAKTNSKAMWGIVSKGLIAARDIWQEGLTEKTYLAYGEIYDGLILASQQMAASEEKSIEADTISLCRELLQYLIGQTEKETAVKKDIVFLPYKASMWDSLESVWKAAYADKEHCNAYVMPIPYCDRNPDGSVAEWHCERDLFPKYVPTLDWQKVDLMAWHPDIILYHYPYDDYNRVTSLDGRYYSRNLRQCADKLVYIPYFVLEEPCTEESVEHFVTTQGVLNADKVIVQSEAMRELYINILMKRTNQPDRAYWEERISGAGSPKIEKVLSSKKEDFEMPEKWKRLVDGKKVILYNTSLTAMLQNSDKVCDKLRYVFDVFRNRDDVVLWWRPHPLMKSTFHSMRPQYEDEYLSLEKQYIEEGWGIYDESPDLHRAICWSDIYYGDQSSVVSLYTCQMKPVVRAKYYKNSLLVHYGKCVSTDDTMYYIPEYYPAIIVLNILTAMIEKIIPIPISIEHFNDYEGYKNGWRNIELLEKTLYLIPFSAECLVKYNLETAMFDFIPFPKNIIDLEERYYHSGISFGFYGSNKKDDVIYMYGVSPIIVYFNTKNNSFNFFRDLYLEKIPLLNQCFTRNGVIVNGHLFIPIEGHLMILEWNISTKKVKLHTFDNIVDGIQFGAIGFDGKVFWITVVGSNKIVKWYVDKEQYYIYQYQSESCYETEPYFSNVVCGNQFIWFIPYHGDRVIKRNEEDGFEIDNRFPIVNIKKIDNPFQANYIGITEKSGNLFCLIHADLGCLLCMDLRFNDIKKKDIRISCDTYRIKADEDSRCKNKRKIDGNYDFWLLHSEDTPRIISSKIGDDIYHILQSAGK